MGYGESRVDVCEIAGAGEVSSILLQLTSFVQTAFMCWLMLQFWEGDRLSPSCKDIFFVFSSPAKQRSRDVTMRAVTRE